MDCFGIDESIENSMRLRCIIAHSILTARYSCDFGHTINPFSASYFKLFLLCTMHEPYHRVLSITSLPDNCVSPAVYIVTETNTVDTSDPIYVAFFLKS